MNKEQAISQALSCLKRIEGWCSPKKATAFINHIFNIDAQICVEIGVFGGSSLIPQALALKAKGSGKIYGIEPFSHIVAIDGMDGPNQEWWGKVDFTKIKQGLTDTVKKLELQSQVELLEMTSSEAASQLNNTLSIDLLHVDGNHSAQHALLDVTTFVPLVRKGGIIFIDDISWGMQQGAATTAKAIEFTLQRCNWIGVIDQCLICQKR